MAEFRWVNVPDAGGCLACGTPVNDRGFVDFIADIELRTPEGDISGVARAYYCATCLEQASRYVGCASRDEVEQFAYREIELVGENDKLKDEVDSWKQRHENLLSNLSQDFRDYHASQNEAQAVKKRRS